MLSFFYRVMRALLLMACVSSLRAADLQMVKIVAHPDLPVSTVSTDEIKSIFLQTKVRLGNTAVAPVLFTSSETRDAFLKQFLGRTISAIEVYYRSLVFSGKGSTPKSFASEKEVLAYISKTKGAIGFVGHGADVSTVKVLEVR